ncbi:CwfJ-like family protein, putative isoform 1 [Hibiscus syriacus]|uniref:CwfJ-like family protein, putative isoform 1 n=1 Tax=Hibiscus syriacus TaxID=106335 RepID=A0A6A3CQQ5_HIBSY|nr:CwfJ-like family protein, putative isoform 1 [Hibiscus syriacus]
MQQLKERLPKSPTVSLSSLFIQNPSHISSPNAKRAPLLVHPNIESHIKHQCRSGKINLNDALSYFEKLIKVKPSPSIDTFNHVLVSVLKLSRDSSVISLRTDIGFCVLGDILKRGFEPDHATVGRLSRGLCAEGKALETVQVFDKMREGGGFQGDVFTYGILISGLCSIRERSSALKLYRKMTKRNCEGDLLIYSTIIGSLCKDKLVDEGLDLFLEMVSKGITPDVVVYGSWLMDCVV